MKIYIASPWCRKAEAIEIGKQFDAAGHDVTSRWFHHQGDPQDPAGLQTSLDAIQHQAQEDIRDVLRSDAFVVLNLERSEGKAVETGIALAASIPVFSVGPRSNIFQALGTEVTDVAECLRLLDFFLVEETG